MRKGLCDKQYDIVHFYNQHQPRHLILEGAIRSGKTYADLLLWIMHVYHMQKPAKDFIITGYTLGSVERNIIKPLSSMLDVSITLDQFGRFDMGPHKVNCFGTNTEIAYKPMQGMTSYGWLANEVTSHHHNSVTEAFQRCSGEGARIFWDTNPDNPTHPVKVNYIDKSGLRDARGDLAIQSFHFVLDDNELLPPEYVEDVKRTTPDGMWYDRRILGKWVAAEGIIFTNWEEIEEIPDEVKNHSHRRYGIDFGFSVHPAVIIDVYFNGDEIWLDELVYSTDMTNYMLANEMKTKCEWGVPIYADSAEPKSIEEIASYGFNIHGASKGPDSVRVGIDWLLGKKIYVTARSHNAIEELQNYAWQINKDGEKLPKPIDAFDHILDSLRYSASDFIDVYRGRLSESSAGDLGL